MKYENMQHAAHLCSSIEYKQSLLKRLQNTTLSANALIVYTFEITFNSELEFNVVKQILIAQTERDIAKLEAELELL